MGMPSRTGDGMYVLLKNISVRILAPVKDIPGMQNPHNKNAGVFFFMETGVLLEEGLLLDL